jgi:hypothetical protein
VPFLIGHPDRNDPAFSCAPLSVAPGRAVEGSRQYLDNKPRAPTQPLPVGTCIPLPSSATAASRRHFELAFLSLYIKLQTDN